MDLPAALAAELGGADLRATRAAALTLRDTYRSGAAPVALALRTVDDALAYAAYRMPATYAAARAALAMGAGSLPTPRTHLDLGGGTGATVWAVGDRWPGTSSTVLDASDPALTLGARLARRGDAALPSTRWEPRRFDPGSELPSADLVSMSYLLGELDEATSARLLDQSLAGARMVLVLEPGTPRGFAAVRAARDRIRAAGWVLHAPCPHALTCPIVDPDWCHFVVRLPRSATHRAAKGAERGFEDEKFSFVLASSPHGQPTPSAEAPVEGRVKGRVLRHPAQRKGLVQLRTCEADGLLHERTVSKRQGDTYRAARDVDWGDPWPS